MFHLASDQPRPDAPPPMTRPQWMALLARAPLDLLEATLESHIRTDQAWLRAPETGLVMVQGRAGGTGERFNLGEVTVTRCALRWAGSESGAMKVGVAYVMGRSHRHAHLAALGDALLQDPLQRDSLESSLLDPVSRHLERMSTQRREQAASTRVEFFSVAREAGDSEEGGR